ncbi:TPA: hypothetical protein DDW69_04525 [candidate division CPR2 bacterium]|uniref:Methyltransferase domain-containing protein n=1 Tax=candidate division CPR2 bacterium GW2011_GWC1_41_48 TaxID=1618344 RepID=A0A0G0W8J3_UNCC2|nr:MAG: hypothetical protein UT47_C0002G0217 [candidate division CPR2 bacterium GW2011_GWC2_39_35]KKR29075.1 MAG: hypothetical protein UT60_C0007G0020 [candidate division CPR2 bacterium GW2011_GWD2_39_7]KKS09309.1 MAG: hypothetical protein UU65_C0002G0087 [candidate division CPR2 bacterium GW2011_GWC1_41_48]OGB70563.1 MAG: hypothetical protein A2Y26_04450 [candidate division CPR2 bacterium GWD2_39_7]HBG82065.1 hypothetical protein [candidate division CPR2 bacterium]
MKKIFGYVLGHQPKLSIEEIKSVYISQRLEFEPKDDSREVFVLESESDVFHRLAGSIKLFEVKKVLSLNDWRPKVLGLEEEVADWIEKEGKIVFGISAYSAKNEKKLVINLGKKVKESLRARGKNSRLIIPKEDDLSSVSVDKNKMLSKGGEVIIFASRQKVYLGLTLKVQDFEMFAKLDYGRPKIDAVSGMLPPKLAQIMVNLTGIHPKGKNLLDPFVGSGTVLQQAAFLGFNDLTGSDISEKAIEDSKTNLSWFKNKLPDIHFKSELYKKDVLKIAELGKSFDVIVSEGYLGPPLKTGVGVDEIQRNVRELQLFYEKAFIQIAKVLKMDGVMVMAIPFFWLQNREIFLEVKIPDTLRLIKKDLKYKRPDQIVGRQIFILKKGYLHA